MKIFLLGKTGQLGWELQRTLALLGEVIAYDRHRLDLTDFQSLRDTLEHTRPQLIVNAAGFTSVDLAESQQELAMLLNAELPLVLAEFARRHNAVLIHYSTDYVFDGSKGSPYIEVDQPNPLNYYGRSKLRGEKLIERSECINIILRTSWMYSLRGVNFVTKTLSWARKHETLRVVSDQIGSPTYALSLAELTALMVARSLPDIREFFFDKSGIYHLGGVGSVSRFDFARKILSLDPRPETQIAKRIEPVLTTTFPTPAQRPLITALNCSHFEHVFGLYLPSWEDALHLALEKNNIV